MSERKSIIVYKANKESAYICIFLFLWFSVHILLYTLYRQASSQPNQKLCTKTVWPIRRRQSVVLSLWDIAATVVAYQWDNEAMMFDNQNLPCSSLTSLSAFILTLFFFFFIIYLLFFLFFTQSGGDLLPCSHPQLFPCSHFFFNFFTFYTCHPSPLNIVPASKELDNSRHLFLHN